MNRCSTKSSSLSVCAVEPAAAAPLLLVRRDRGALDVAGVRDGDDHVLFGDQILDRELALVARDLGAALVAVLRRRSSVSSSLRIFMRFGLRREQRAQLLDRSPRTSLSSSSSFSISRPVSLARRMLRIASACRSDSLNRACSCALAVGVSSAAADDLDHLVDVVDGDLEAFEDVLALERLVEVELRAADDDLVAVRRCSARASP